MSPVSRYFPADESGNPPETLILTPSGEQFYVESAYAPPTLELTPRQRERLDAIKDELDERMPIGTLVELQIGDDVCIKLTGTFFRVYTHMEGSA